MSLYIESVLIYLDADGIAELSRLSHIVPLPIQCDIAEARLNHDQFAHEPLAISLLVDHMHRYGNGKTLLPRWVKTEQRRGFLYLRQCITTPTTMN
jgi:hypothetical protein